MLAGKSAFYKIGFTYPANGSTALLCTCFRRGKLAREHHELKSYKEAVLQRTPHSIRRPIEHLVCS